MIVLRQYEYSKKDMEGLTKKGQRILRRQRNDLARKFKEEIKDVKSKYEEEVNRIKSTYTKDSEVYNNTIKKAERAREEALDKIRGKINSEKAKLKYNVHKEATPTKAAEFIRNHAKPIIAGTSVLGGAGLAYVGYKGVKHYRDKKKSDEVRRQVLGDVDKKKKKGN